MDRGQEYLAYTKSRKQLSVCTDNRRLVAILLVNPFFGAYIHTGVTQIIDDLSKMVSVQLALVFPSRSPQSIVRHAVRRGLQPH